jgi:short-subunit dehydrogenase
MKLEGKRVILTGASSGIGLELLSHLDRKGALTLAVGLGDFDTALASVTYFKQDISSNEGIDTIFAAATNVLGGVDIFIANAGFAYYEEATKADWQRAESIFHTNVLSTIYAFHQLKASKGNDPFQFVVTASAMSYVPLPGYALYSASKHAVQGFFEAARFELPNHQVVTLIHPIATKTAFFKGDTPVPFPTQSSKIVARRYIRGIERNRAHIFPSLLFAFIRHFGLFHYIIKKIDAHKFSAWRANHE